MSPRQLIGRAMGGGLAVLLVAAALGLWASVGAASEPPPAVTAASLTQDGQDLLWQLKLDRPFSAASLQRGQSSLCLLIERPASGSVEGELCLAPGRDNRPPDRLAFTAGPGSGRIVAATVTRPSATSMNASFLPTSVGLGYRQLRWQVRILSTASACSGQCLALSPARPSLLRLHVPKLVGCVASGSNFVFHGPTNVRDIALAFDDGPWYDTPQFLSLLEREHVPATFFQIGDQIGEYGQRGALERRMLRDGDMIGDHTWTHPDVSGAGSFARTQIVQTADAIRNATGGFYPCLFRAPYGATSPALLSEVRSLGMTTIQWNVDPRDWAMPGVGEIESNVLTNASNGAILEMHDGGGNRSETIAALPTIIGTLRKRGYEFVTITQMLGYRLIYK